MRKPTSFLRRLKAIPTDGMGDKDLLSHRVMQRQIEREDINYELKNYEMPVNQQNGVHTRLADLPLCVPLRFCAALPGLHFPATPNPARAGANDRGDAAGSEGRIDAAEDRAREAARPMRWHHRRKSIPHPDDEVSDRIFRARTRSG